jgi:hypothetical protein
MKTFGIQVPFWKALTYIPLLLLVASIPVTPYGLGTVQLVAVHLFAPYAPGGAVAQEATVLGYSLAVTALSLLLQALLGLVFMRRAMAMAAAANDERAGSQGAGGAGL